MPRGGRGGHHHSTRKPVDLSGIISLAEKNDLIVLTNAVTERLHKDLCVVFDSPPVTPINHDQQGHHHWLAKSLTLHSHSKHNQKHTELPSSNIQPNTQGDGSQSFKTAHSIIEKEEQEAMTPQLRELKKEAVASFKKWQNLVLLRIRDLVVQEPDVSSRPNQRGRGGRGGERGGLRGRGGRGGINMTQPVRPPTTLATGPPRVPTSPTDLPLTRRYPPIPNTLWPLPAETRKLLLHIILLMLLSLQEYSSHSRHLLLYLASSLNLSLRIFQEGEVRVARALASVALETPLQEVQDQEPGTPKAPRRWKYGLGVPGMPGALAGPLATAGIGGLQNSRCLSANMTAGLLGSLADNGHVVGSLFGMNATRPASKSLETYARDVPDFGLLTIHDDIPVEYPDSGVIPRQQRRLRLVIVISGWLILEKDLPKPWKCLGDQAECYALRWELHALLSFGHALQTVIKSTAWAKARKDIGTRSVRLSLHNSHWPEPLLKMSKIIDNAWSVGMVRAEKAGVVLADALMRNKFQGDRPVSLIGYSLAARVIYTCLMVLAERRCFGVVDSVVMMGAPAPSESRVWLTLKSVVSGRLVNVFSENDYILGFLCRTSNIHFGIAGLEEVQGADGVENINVTRSVDGHLTYQSIAGRVLQDIGWEDTGSTEPRPRIAPPTIRGRRR